MSPLISLSRDKSLWRFEKVLDHKWKVAPRPLGGVCLGGTLYRFKSHRYMILNIDGHELEIAAVYENRGKYKGTGAVCHLDSSYVGSNNAFSVNHGFYGGGSLKSLTEGSGRFMYVKLGGALVGVSSPRLVQRETTNSYRMLNPTVQVWARVEPQQGSFVERDLIELKRWSPSELRFTGDYEPRYWLGGPEKKSEPIISYCCAPEGQSFTGEELLDGVAMGSCKWELKEPGSCDCDWCSNRLKRFGSTRTAKNNKNSAP